MKMSLDRPEIMQIHRFMEYSMSSYLDLQFVLPKIANKASDIQKTVIFTNGEEDIPRMLDIFESWMKKKGYPEDCCSEWIRPYHPVVSDWSKALNSKAFAVPQENNTECTILVATDTEGKGIDYADVKLVIQWDFPLSLDSMIQRMGCAGRNGAQSTFVFFTPKWSRVDDPGEIEKRLTRHWKSAPVVSAEALAANSQLSNSNRPKARKPRPDVSDSEGTEAEFCLDDEELILRVLATEADQNRINAKRELQQREANAEKRAKMSDEIFHYIHVARCRRLFALACSDDLTYAEIDGSCKPLPTNCCNGLDCLSPEPEFMHREPLIKVPTVPCYTEFDREWIACRYLALTKWRKETSYHYWQDLEEDMPDSILMSDSCLAGLSISEQLLNHDNLLKYLQLRGVDEYADEILICLQKNSPTSSSPDSRFKPPSESKRKAKLLEFRTAKKQKLADAARWLEAEDNVEWYDRTT